MFTSSTFMAITLLVLSSVPAKVSVAQYDQLNKGTLVILVDVVSVRSLSLTI